MLQILALLLLTGAAVDIARKVYCHRAIFAQLRQTTAIAWLVWLYPLPFFLPLLDKSFFPLLLFRIPIGILFFVPALISARANQKCFEMSGDDRVKPALGCCAYYIVRRHYGYYGSSRPYLCFMDIETIRQEPSNTQISCKFPPPTSHSPRPKYFRNPIVTRLSPVCRRIEIV
jgi:hypothetical protein